MSRLVHRVPVISILGALLALCTPLLRADVEIPFSFEDGMIWVRVALPGAGRPLNFLLDTGSEVTVLDLNSAHRLGLQMRAAETVQGVSGKSRAYSVRGFCGAVAGQSLPREVLAWGLEGPSSHVHQPIDGLLGADFLKRRVVEIDFSTKKLRLLEPAESRVSAYIPMRRSHGALCVPVTIAGHRDQWMRLDTGCRTALQWVRPSRRGTTAVSHNIQADIQLGTVTLRGIDVAIRRKAIFPGEAGLIGNELLSRFRLTVDLVKNRLYLTPRR